MDSGSGSSNFGSDDFVNLVEYKSLDWIQQFKFIQKSHDVKIDSNRWIQSNGLDLFKVTKLDNLFS